MDAFSRTMIKKASLLFLAGVVCGLAVFPVQPHVHAQADPVAVIMSQMTTQEKVGQLVLVAFWGRGPTPQSWAGKLIQEYKVGGVVLMTSNSNLSNSDPNTPAEVASLCNNLQTMALDEAGSGIPLFVAIDHEGDGFPYTRITNGMTPLPSPMAIGATWNAQYAEQTGEIVGRELAAMGINMLLGPVLDVLDDPRPGSKGDVGSRVFGGDPYWVGEMGRAYIRGVHSGSGGKVLTVAKHFPGHGGSDRLPDDEVATVDKSLQELRRVELAPFFAVTNAKDTDGSDQTDALMSSHIRYRGFYGDIRQFTRPITFDAEGMEALFRLEELREWRKNGVMVSDSLGVPAVRKYFDPQLLTFPHRQIAREAFLAGNDLLILSQFFLSFDLLQHYANVVEVLEYFRQAYEQEPAFAARVDDAVQRILRLKLRLYPDMSLTEVLATPEQLRDVGNGTAVVEEIARKAVTVLQPTEDSLPRPPHRGDDILIFVEERLIKECYDAFPECEPQPLVPVAAVQETILRLYGPQGTMLVDPADVQTRTFAELKAFLTLPRNTQTLEGSTSPPEPTPESTSDQPASLEQLLQEAEWIVFVLFEPTSWYPDSEALQLFLAQDAQRIYNASVVALAYTVPYYLDVTEISKLTAYYVFYGKTWPFIETSVRTLFGEVRPQGKSPVSIEGTYYDLATQLLPDPTQQIPLTLVEPEVTSALAPVTLHVRAGVILDHNGNPVPDGTQVRFVVRDSLSSQPIVSAEGATVSGIAEADLAIDRPARLQITASSGGAADGSSLLFTALPQPTPTLLPSTKTPQEASTPTLAPTNTPVPSPTATPTRTPASPQPTPMPTLPVTWVSTWAGRPLDLPGVFGGIVLAAATGHVWWGRRTGLSRRVRLVLLAWIGGLVGYTIYGLGWFSVISPTVAVNPTAAQWLAWGVSGILTLIGAMAAVTVAGMTSRKTLVKNARS